ncbi:MAG: PAS domain-containing protein [Nitrospirota bacterium]|nr:PAS domain-containing protein [Nitrospirota bacterium]
MSLAPENEQPWQRQIRRQTALLILLVVALVTTGIGYDRWWNNRQEMLRRQIEKDHLTAAVQSAQALSELLSVRLDLMPAILPGTPEPERISARNSVDSVLDAVHGHVMLLDRFNLADRTPALTTLLDIAVPQSGQVLASWRNLGVGDNPKPLTDAVNRLADTLEQLERQHVWQYERESELLIASGKTRFAELLAVDALLAALGLLLTYGIFRSINRAIQRQQSVENSLARAQSIAHIGHWEWDIGSGALLWSDEVYRIFGHAPKAFPADYRSFLQQVHEDDRQAVESGVAAAVDPARRIPYAVEHRVLRPDGALRCVQERGEVTFDPASGQPLRMLGTVQDITRFKEVEQALRDSKAAMTQAQRIGRMGHYQLDIERGLAYLSDEAFRVIGRPPAEDMPLDEILNGVVVEEDRERVKAELESALRGGQSFITFHRVRHLDGSIHWVNVVGEIIFHSGTGQPQRMVGVLRDITEEKIARDEILRLNHTLEQRVRERTRDLEREKQRLADYLNIAANLIVALDHQGRVTLLNRKAYQVLGYPEGTLEGHDWFDLILPEPIRASVRTMFEVSLRDATLPDHFENQVLTRGGTQRLVEWHNVLLRDATGAVIGTLSSGLDITDQRRAELELRRAQRMEALGNLSGGIAHSLNNLLLPISTLTQITCDDLPMDSKHRGNLERVMQASQRAADLTRRILAFSRWDEPRLEVVDMAQLVNDTLSLILPSTPASANLNASVDADVGRVLGDPGQLEGVLMNIVSNAVDALEGKPGDIRVEVASGEGHLGLFPNMFPDGAVHIRVKDSGCGMSPEVRERIFDPFFTTKPVGRGTGLGLSMAHGIITRHEGVLEVESKPGRGTRVDIYLPRTSLPSGTRLPETGAPQSTVLEENHGAHSGD